MTPAPLLQAPERPFRVGATSYVLPDEILPNVRFLGPRVDDVEILLFEVDEAGDDLPDARTVAELAALAARHGLGYTVHLPLDFDPGRVESRDDPTLARARLAVERTRPLEPWAWVVHVDPAAADEGWVDRACVTLGRLAELTDGPERLAVENVERTDPDLLAPLLDRLPLSRCLDVGHLWDAGRDPTEWVETAADRIRVVHAHGIGERDHRSLALVPRVELDRLCTALITTGFDGVLTLEVFDRTALDESLTALDASLRRIAAR